MRRKFLIVSGALLAAPLVGAQQSTASIRRIAILDLADKASNEGTWRLFDTWLRELGYIEGKNLSIDRRWADGAQDRSPQLAQELLAGRPEVVVVTGTPTTRALMRLTNTIPIVMIGAAEPVATGLIKSMSRPGGNVTGVTFLQAEITVKRIDLLREIVPGATRFGLLGPSENSAVLAVLKHLQSAARPMGIDVRLLDAGNALAIAGIFERLSAEPVDALIVASALRPHYRQIVDLAARFRIPDSYVHKEPLEDGALIVYSPERNALFKHAANYVARILKGAKPADLPVEQPTEFWLGVNLRTARRLSLKIPQSVLSRADRVIE